METNNIEVSINDSYYKKNLGKYSGPLSNLMNNINNIQLGQDKFAKISIES